MSISFYGYVREGDCYEWAAGLRERIQCYLLSADIMSDEEPEDNSNYDPECDVNLSNRNAHLVLLELGFVTDADSMWEAVPLSINAFEAGLIETIRRNPEPVPGFDGLDHGNIITFGVADGYVNERLAQLRKFVTKMRGLGATHIGWG